MILILHLIKDFVCITRRSGTPNRWGSEKSLSSSTTSEESASTAKSYPKEDAEVQTGGELLKKYEPVVCPYLIQ